MTDCCDSTTDYPLPQLLKLLHVEFPPPLDSLEHLHEYAAQRCVRLAPLKPLLFTQYLQCNQPGTDLILRALGYLSNTPWLRIVIFHLVLSGTQPMETNHTPTATTTTKVPSSSAHGSTSSVPDTFESRCEIAMRVMDLLRRDVDGYAIHLENMMRERLRSFLSYGVGSDPAPSVPPLHNNISNNHHDSHPYRGAALSSSWASAVVEQQPRRRGTNDRSSRLSGGGENVAALSLLAKRQSRSTKAMVQRLKQIGPRPAIIIVPSRIALANYGLYVRGKLSANTFVAGYAGEREVSMDHSSGYRMEYRCNLVIDACKERCLCSMMNDARNSVFNRNCGFIRSNQRGVVARTREDVEDEELFTVYGSGFKLSLEGTVASFTRTLLPDLSATETKRQFPHIPAQESTLEL